MAPGSVIAFAPGRVHLLGGADGRLALSVAIDRGVTVRATTLPGPLMMVRIGDPRETDVFDAWRPGEPGCVVGRLAVVRGTAAELTAAGHPVRPARVGVSATLPRGSGLASSTALGVAVALALLGHAGAQDLDRREVARICSRVGERWIGAPSGLADAYASLLAVAGHVLLIDRDAGSVDAVPAAFDGWTLAVVDTGARGPGPQGRRHSSGPDARGEDERVRRAAKALRRGDVASLGPLLDASHADSRDASGGPGDGVDDAVQRCRACGAAGARMIGGRSGRSVLALMPPGTPPPPGALILRPGAAARCP